LFRGRTNHEHEWLKCLGKACYLFASFIPAGTQDMACVSSVGMCGRMVHFAAKPSLIFILTPTLNIAKS
jgi:hypothetical protein